MAGRPICVQFIRTCPNLSEPVRRIATTGCTQIFGPMGPAAVTSHFPAVLGKWGNPTEAGIDRHPVQQLGVEFHGSQRVTPRLSLRGPASRSPGPVALHLVRWHRDST